MRLGDLVSQARQRAGMSLQDLSDATSITKSHLHAIEKGATVNIEIMSAIRLSVALGIPINALASAALESSS